MTSEIHVKTRTRIESVKKKLRAIDRPITVKDYSEADAGLVAESVL
jgi:hypothetical protein